MSNERMRILVVDDDPSVLCQMLARGGIRYHRHLPDHIMMVVFHPSHLASPSIFFYDDHDRQEIF